MADKVDKADKNIGHIIPHSHWDREWRYPIWKNRMLLVQMMEELLEVLDKNPDYKTFVMDGQSVIVGDYLQVRPADSERVRNYIKQGRLSCGPWYSLPDLYPVSGESMVRNLLKGVRYSESLGGHLTVGYTSFGWGQTAQFPQIFRGFGIDVVLTAKYVSSERAPDDEFVWKAPDGSEVLTSKLGKGGRHSFFINAYVPVSSGKAVESDYNLGECGTVYHEADDAHHYRDFATVHDATEIHDELLKESLQQAWDNTDGTTIKSNRLLMSGCDFSNSLPLLPEILRRGNKLFDDKKFVFTTLQEYAAILKEKADYSKLKVVDGELRDGSPLNNTGNALATRSYIKRLNKKVQNMMFGVAEPLSVMNALSGGMYQTEFFQVAMDYMLKSQAHDSINGVTQDKTVDDVMHRLSQSLEICDVVTNQVCAEIVAKINTDSFNSEDVLLVVFNPTPRKQNEVMKTWIYISDKLDIWDFDIQDADGNIKKVQQVSRAPKAINVSDPNARPWGFEAIRHCVYFEAGEIPACGYSVFKIVPRYPLNRPGYINVSQQRTSPGGEISQTANTLENEFLKVQVNPNGSINLLDKKHSQSYQNLNYFEDSGDCGNYWAYYPHTSNKTFNTLGKSANIYLEDNGTLSATITAEIILYLPVSGTKNSNHSIRETRRSDETREVVIRTSYTLTKSARRVDVKTVINNTVEDHRMRAMFDTGIVSEYAHAAGHFTVDKRPVSPNRDQYGEYFQEMQTLPQQDFVDVSDGSKGLALINNCLSEFEAMENPERTVALTLFRAMRNAVCTTDLVWTEFPDQKGGQSLGVQEYEYAVYPHAGMWDEGDVYNEVENFNAPLKLVQTSKHNGGTLPTKHGFIEIDNSNLVVSAIKKAEDRDTFIIRLCNPTDGEIRALLKFSASVSGAWLTNLNEERDVTITLESKNEIPVVAGPQKIVTVEIKTG